MIETRREREVFWMPLMLKLAVQTSSNNCEGHIGVVLASLPSGSIPYLFVDSLFAVVSLCCTFPLSLMSAACAFPRLL